MRGVQRELLAWMKISVKEEFNGMVPLLVALKKNTQPAFSDRMETG